MKRKDEHLIWARNVFFYLCTIVKRETKERKRLNANRKCQWLKTTFLTLLPLLLCVLPLVRNKDLSQRSDQVSVVNGIQILQNAHKIHHLCLRLLILFFVLFFVFACDEIDHQRLNLKCTLHLIVRWR